MGSWYDGIVDTAGSIGTGLAKAASTVGDFIGLDGEFGLGGASKAYSLGGLASSFGMGDSANLAATKGLSSGLEGLESVEDNPLFGLNGIAQDDAARVSRVLDSAQTIAKIPNVPESWYSVVGDKLDTGLGFLDKHKDGIATGAGLYNMYAQYNANKEANNLAKSAYARELSKDKKVATGYANSVFRS